MEAELRSAFQALYGETPRVFRAPGRVNLIGEHTDYNDGFVMPAALQFASWVAVSARDDRQVVLHSQAFEGQEVKFDLDTLKPGQHMHHWADYVRGVAWALLGAGHPITGANLMVCSNVPIGSGLSSSASVEVATARALLRDIPVDGPQLARLCQKAENDYVMMRCGIMDQYISANGEADHALMLDCRSLEHRLLPLPPDVRLVIVNSGVKHALAGGEYNHRREMCEQSAGLLGITALRDATLQDVSSRLPVDLQPYARHVVSENARVEESARALLAGDLGTFGRLMYESHTSMRYDYRITCDELDLLVDLARELPGVFGARMTGGGFGGCTVNLVRAEDADAFEERIRTAYESRTSIRAEIYQCRASQGAGEVLAS